MIYVMAYLIFGMLALIVAEHIYCAICNFEWSVKRHGALTFVRFGRLSFSYCIRKG
jgi:hypothetical protein